MPFLARCSANALAALALVLTGCVSAPPLCEPATPPAVPVIGAAPSKPVQEIPGAAPDPVTVAASPVADAALREALVGSWIVARDSPDWRPVPARELYRADGTYTLYYYSSPDCAEPIARVDAVWQVELGVLQARVTRSQPRHYATVDAVSRDEIVSLDGDGLRLRPLKSGLLQKLSTRSPDALRRRSDGCWAASSG